LVTYGIRIVSTLCRKSRLMKTIRVRKITGHEKQPDLDDTTPAQRLGMMWQLTADVWAFKGESVAQSRLPRHVVRIVRRES